MIYEKAYCIAKYIDLLVVCDLCTIEQQIYDHI